nr:NAD-dependent epimerase/dehydratase family protein [Nonomuraea sp. K271]
MAGATGVLGRHVVPRLLAEGHRVTALTRGRRPVPDGAAAVRGDVIDAHGLALAVREAAPDVVMHQLTDLQPVPAADCLPACCQAVGAPPPPRSDAPRNPAAGRRQPLRPQAPGLGACSSLRRDGFAQVISRAAGGARWAGVTPARR